MGERTKVAVLVGALEVGGAELDIARNFPRLNRNEFDVVVVSFGTAGALGPELERHGIRVVARLDSERVSDGVPARAWRYVAVTRWVARVFADEQIDIAHFFLPHAYVYGMAACLLGRRSAKTVMSRLSLNFYESSHRMIARAERSFAHPRVDIAIGNSHPILTELAEEGVAPDKLRLIHNGIEAAPLARGTGDREEARTALAIAPDAFVIVAVGNLHIYKGHADLIEACALVASNLPPSWRLLIAGRDEQGNAAALTSLASQRGIAEHVELLGQCDDVAQLLHAADVFAHPSHHEGLPNALLEAMAAGLPVVATEVGGIPEAVVPAGAVGQTGWLVAPHVPQALAGAIEAACADPARRAAMGESATARIMAEFSLDSSVAAYEAVYRGLRD
ncbi:MAG: glycosyltransferase [Coriobacteriia bacterium]|nr:glycosyltransferase [Coriobacteriia bacterium]